MLAALVLACAFVTGVSRTWVGAVSFLLGVALLFVWAYLHERAG